MGVAIGILLLCVLAALIAIHKRLRFRRLEKLDADSRVIGYYRYYLAVLSRFGWKRMPHETYCEFAERLKIGRSSVSSSGNHESLPARRLQQYTVRHRGREADDGVPQDLC